MDRYRVPLYVEVDCVGVDERDAADRASQALYSLNLQGKALSAELRPGQPILPEHGDPRVRVFVAEHLSHAISNGRVKFVHVPARPQFPARPPAGG